jgi:hypothetical protein
MRRVALAWLVGTSAAVGGCASAPIATAPPERYVDEVAAVVQRIDEGRAELGKPASQPLHRLAPDMKRLAAAFERGEKDPQRALQELLQKGKESLAGGRAIAWIAFGKDREALARLEVPEWMRTATTLRVVVGIARCRPSGVSTDGYCALVAAIEQMGTIAPD